MGVDFVVRPHQVDFVGVDFVGRPVKVDFVGQPGSCNKNLQNDQRVDFVGVDFVGPPCYNRPSLVDEQPPVP